MANEKTPQNQPVKSSLGLLSKLGLDIDNEVAGYEVAAAAKIDTMPNVFGITITKGDGKTKKFLVGKKSMDAGCIIEKDGKLVMADGFETYDNTQQGGTWLRSKAAARPAASMNF